MMMLLSEYRIVQVRVNTTSLTISASQWWQYRIGLSSLLWSLVTDGLLECLSKQGIFTRDYADDRIVLVWGKFLFFCLLLVRLFKDVVLFSVASKNSAQTENSVSPSQTETIQFTRRYKVDGLNPLKPSVIIRSHLGCKEPYRPNLPFSISDIRALWRSELSARVPECQKLKTVG